MRVIRFETSGNPSVLEMADVADQATGENTALVRVMAASINPSNVKNVAGAMKQTILPRTPGRDYAGVVEAGPAHWRPVGLTARSETASPRYLPKPPRQNTTQRPATRG